MRDRGEGHRVDLKHCAFGTRAFVAFSSRLRREGFPLLVKGGLGGVVSAQSITGLAGPFVPNPAELVRLKRSTSNLAIVICPPSQL